MMSTRRGLLVAAVSAAPALQPGAAWAELPTGGTLLVPGPEEAPLARWAARFAAVPRAAGLALTVERQLLGGPDGVTAANRFAAEAAPDGTTLLVYCGAAGQALLAGDRRARFDAAGWQPVCASQTSLVLAGRGPLSRAARAPLHLALGPVDAAGAAGLLALDLLGIPAAPLLGLSAAEAEAAFREGRAEAIVLAGEEIPARLALLGAQPWLVPDAALPGRDLTLPEVPGFAELRPGAAAVPAALAEAARAAGSAARLMAALVLPALTAANATALWRGAAQRWRDEEARSGTPAPRPLSLAETAALLAALQPSAPAVAAYRDWLARRLNWRAE